MEKILEKLPKALAFDLDGTLAPSKSHLEPDMAEVLSKLLKYIPLAVISGASRAQFELQFLKYLDPETTNFSNLYIFPENGACLITYSDGKWSSKYDHDFTEEEVAKITNALNSAIEKFSLSRELAEEKGWGELIENRGAQITLSALGQKAPLESKQSWDPDQKKRTEIRTYLNKYLLSDCEIRIGGTTSIDITKKGINKAFGINNYLEILKISKEDLTFFGDALYPGGNDEIVKETGVICVQVDNPQATIAALRDILQGYEKTNR